MFNILFKKSSNETKGVKNHEKIARQYKEYSNKDFPRLVKIIGYYDYQWNLNIKRTYANISIIYPFTIGSMTGN